MKIRISTSILRIRANHSTTSASLGFAKEGVHEVLETYDGSSYKWYRIEEGWVAGIDEVKEVEESTVVPVEEDKSKDQIYIGTDSLRIRTKPSTSGETVGFCEMDVFYNVYDTKKDVYYTWYKIGEDAWCAGVDGVRYHPANEWIAPIPTGVNTFKNQVYIGDISLKIRASYSTSSEQMGLCEKDANYDVLAIKKESDYTWYQIGEKAWIAQVDDQVIYYPAGSTKITPELKKELNLLKSNADVALKCIEKNRSTALYEALYNKIKTINDYISNYFDPFEYDYVDEKEYDEIDLLYTTDVHGAWVGYSLDGNYMTPIFSYQDVANYQKKLEKNNIKALLVDAGDWSRPSKAYNDYLNTGIMYPAEEMKKADYFMATYGNHEWRWSQYGQADTESILNKLGCMCACNLFKNGKLVYAPYRTARIGSKRIAVIGIGYPSANGSGDYNDGIWTFGEYQFYDDARLFNQVQKCINTLKDNGFDYIVAVGHMCKSTYESDSRYNARTDSLIQNTKGLTAVIQGHYNFATNAEIIKDKGGNSVLLAHEAGANLNSFGRLKMKDGNITSYLLDERSDLNVI